MQISLSLGTQNSLFWFLSLNDSFLYPHSWTQRLEKVFKLRLREGNTIQEYLYYLHISR